MRDQDSLSRLVESIQPSAEGRDRVWNRIQSKLEPVQALSEVFSSVSPSEAQKQDLRSRVFARITPPIGEVLKGLSSTVTFPLRSLNFLAALEPTTKAPRHHSWLRWSTAFVLVVVAFRLAPLAILSPTQADSAVQLVPSGDGVQIFVGGVWRTLDRTEVLTSAIMISTDGNSEATIILNDDGVLRLAHDTTLKLHDLGDRPQRVSAGPTATLVRGTVWALGLLPPFIDGLSLETSHGMLALNAGSASIQEVFGKMTEISVFDRGVTFTSGEQQVFLVSGESLVASEKIRVGKIADRTFTEEWPQQNLSSDAVHRSEIAKLQEERQKKVAGILPGSAWYPVKRVAEKVDTFFALTSEAQQQKQIDQANTRLSEALALIKEGQNAEAEAPLAEYTTSLLALADTGDDTLVRHLLARTIAEEVTKMSADDADATFGKDQNLVLLQNAMNSVAAAVPNADVALLDLEGYLLVDKLAEMRHMLEISEDPEKTAAFYHELRPYLTKALSEESGTNPLLMKEAKALLLSSSTLAQSSGTKAPDALLIALDKDVSTFLPQEFESLKITSEELDARVAVMLEHILLFRHPTSRYTQLLTEMREIQNDPNRGTLLRRLKTKLPEGLGEYVNTELKNLVDELKS